MQRSKFRFSMVAAAALAVVGATPTGQSASLYPDNPNATPQKTVLVRNHNSLDVEVVAVTEAGRRFRLGAVHRGAGRTFILPPLLLIAGRQGRTRGLKSQTNTETVPGMLPGAGLDCARKRSCHWRSSRRL